MHKQKQQLILLILLFASGNLRCAYPGENPHSSSKRRRKPTTEEEKETEKKKKSPTFVGVSLLGQSSPVPPLCSDPLAAPRFIQLGNNFSLDGMPADWQQPAQAEDPLQDATILDLNKSYIGTSQRQLRNDVVGGILFGENDVLDKINAGQAVYLEFGHLQIDGGTHLRMQADRLFRIDKDGFAELLSGVWDVFAILNHPSVKGGFQINEGFLEWMLDERQLDDVTGQSTWWYRVYSHTANATLDTIAVSYFNSEATPTNPDFILRRCNANSFDKQAFSFSEIYRQDIPQALAHRAFDVVRMAYENIQNLLAYKSFATDHLPVVLTSLPNGYDFALLSNLESEHALLNGLYLQLTPQMRVDLENEQYDTLYIEVCQKLLSYYLRQSFLSAPTYLTSIVEALVTAELQNKVLGLYSWLNAYRKSTLAFQKFTEPAANFSIPAWASLSPQDPSLQSKITAFAYILSQYTDAKSVLSIWQHLIEQTTPNDTLEVFLQLVKEEIEHKSENTNEDINSEQLWEGWLRETPYVAPYSPTSLFDNDADGIPTFYENATHTKPANIDTDNDGWSDLAELFQNMDPLSTTSSPDTIVADNYFADWEELLPDKIVFQATRILPQCPSTARIGSVAAILANKKLVVGAMAVETWTESGVPVSWEAQVDIVAAKKKFLITAKSGDYFFKVINAKTEELLAVIPTLMPQGIKTSEWFLDFNRLDVSNKDLTAKNGLRLKVSTIAETAERKICDQSVWFSPTVKPN